MALVGRMVACCEYKPIYDYSIGLNAEKYLGQKLKEMNNQCFISPLVC